MANKSTSGKPFKMPMKPVKVKRDATGVTRIYKAPKNPYVKGPTAVHNEGQRQKLS